MLSPAEAAPHFARPLPSLRSPAVPRIETSQINEGHEQTNRRRPGVKRTVAGMPLPPVEANSSTS